MNGVTAIMRRELQGYFATPLAYVFIVIFLVLAGWFTFNFGNFYNGGQASLAPFFNYHPWLYLFLVPALSMRLWAEEHKTGTIELLMTLPLDVWQSVAGKFIAAWAFTALALALTFPIWITVNYLGEPDKRRHRRGLPGEPDDGRRVPCHRRLRLGDHQQPGHRLHRHRGDLFRHAHAWVPAVAEPAGGLGSAADHRCRGVPRSGLTL